MSRLKRFLKARTYSGLANALFGGFVDKYGDQLYDLEIELDRANMSDLFRTYVSEMILTSLIIFAMFFASVGLISYQLGLNPALSAVLLFSVPYVLSSMVFVIMYFYPFQKSHSRAKDIDRNLPFALNQMASVAGSGVPPVEMFDLLTGFESYGAISEEADRVLRKVEVFGEDLTTALKEVARTCPSDELTDVLYGMVSTIETGGDLAEFLQQQADSAFFEYRLEREKQIDSLTTYASFYTALLVAAPLFLIAVLSVLNLIGGSLMGFAIGELMNLGVYVLIPTINIAFILILEITQEVF